MKQEKKQSTVSRRDFLQGAAAVGAGAAVLTASGSVVAATPESPDEQAKPKGYRLTRHIIDYYKTAAG